MVTLFLKCTYPSGRRGTKFTFTLSPEFPGPKLCAVLSLKPRFVATMSTGFSEILENLLWLV